MMLHASILIAIAGTASASSRNMVEDTDLPFSRHDKSLAATHLRIRWNKDGMEKAFTMPLNYDNIRSSWSGMKIPGRATNRVVFTGYQRPRPVEKDYGFYIYKGDDNVQYGNYKINARPNSTRAGYDTRVRCRVEVESYRTSSKGYAKITIDLGCDEHYAKLSGTSSGKCIELHDHLMALGKGLKSECLDNCEGRGVRFEAQVDFESKEEQDLYNSNMVTNRFASLQPFHKVKLFSKTKGYTGSSPRIQYLCPKHHDTYQWDNETRGSEVSGSNSGIYMGMTQKWEFDDAKGHSVKKIIDGGEHVAMKGKIQNKLWKTSSYAPKATSQDEEKTTHVTLSIEEQFAKHNKQRQRNRWGY